MFLLLCTAEYCCRTRGSGRCFSVCGGRGNGRDAAPKINMSSSGRKTQINQKCFKLFLYIFSAGKKKERKRKVDVEEKLFIRFFFFPRVARSSSTDKSNVFFFFFPVCPGPAFGSVVIIPGPAMQMRSRICPCPRSRASADLLISASILSHRPVINSSPAFSCCPAREANFVCSFELRRRT